MLNSTVSSSINTSLLNATFLNSSSPIDAGTADPLTSFAGVSAVALILLLNGVVLAMLMFNRSLLQESFCVHILSLCFTDFSVGLLSLPIVTLRIYRPPLMHSVCAASLAFYAIGQCASLYHVLGICIYRVLILRKNEQPPKWKQQYLRYHVPAAWISSAIVLSFPFVYWRPSDPDVTVCFVNTYFGRNFMKALGFIVGCYFPALALTDILYVYLKVLLHKQPQVPGGLQSRRQTQNLIGIILGLFNVFLLPFIIGSAVEVTFESVSLSQKVRSFFLSWAMLNSILNPIIYAGRVKQLRESILASFRNIVACRCLRNACFGSVARMQHEKA